MIIYRLFDGREFNNQQDYDKALASCLSTEVYKFHPRHLTKYIQEMYPDLVKIVDSITCEGSCAESERIKVVNRIPIDGKLANKSPRPDSEHIVLSVVKSIPKNLFLCDFRKFVFDTIQTMFNNANKYLDEFNFGVVEE